MKIWGLGQISNDEKANILAQHRELYNGYQTMEPKVSNTQPLYVQDFANDKGGLVVNNKGEVKTYTNMGINEQTESKEVCDECGSMQMSEDVCNECGGTLEEGECMECGWKNEEIQQLSPSRLMKGDKYKFRSPSFEDDIEFDSEIEDKSGGKPMFKFKGVDTTHLMGDKDIESFVSSIDEEKEVCSECGGTLEEGECMECGWKGEVGDMDEENIRIDQVMTRLKEEIGHLDDIYKVKDLNPKAKFDYVQGAGNDSGTFEGMHKDLYKEDDGEDTGYVDFVDNFDNPDNEDDGFEDLQASGGEMYEEDFQDMENGEDLAPAFQNGEFIGMEKPSGDMEIREGGYTGGGNAPDFDLSNIEPGYNFRTKGPEMGDGPFDQEAEDMDLDKDQEWSPYNFESGGPDEVFPTYEGEVKEYEKMESAWADDEAETNEQGWATVARIAAPIAVNYAIDKLTDGELEEVNDISGVQGIYGAMKPPYDFDSEGPGKAGPYQTSSWGGDVEHSKMSKQEDEDAYWEEDLEPGELSFDLEKFNPEDKSWEEIKAHTGNWDEIDEDLRENFIIQKNKITEMFNRFKMIK